jgi:hypothetical protein
MIYKIIYWRKDMSIGLIDCGDNEDSALDAYAKIIDGETILIKKGEQTVQISPIMAQLVQIILGDDDKVFMGELTKTGKEIVGKIYV